MAGCTATKGRPHPACVCMMFAEIGWFLRTSVRVAVHNSKAIVQFDISLNANAQGSTLTGNTAATNGGAVTCLSCGDLIAGTTTFANNTASEGFGGGVQCASRTKPT